MRYWRETTRGLRIGLQVMFMSLSVMSVSPSHARSLEAVVEYEWTETDGRRYSAALLYRDGAGVADSPRKPVVLDETGGVVALGPNTQGFVVWQCVSGRPCVAVTWDREWIVDVGAFHLPMPVDVGLWEEKREWGLRPQTLTAEGEQLLRSYTYRQHPYRMAISFGFFVVVGIGMGLFAAWPMHRKPADRTGTSVWIDLLTRACAVVVLGPIIANLVWAITIGNDTYLSPGSLSVMGLSAFLVTLIISLGVARLRKHHRAV